MEYYKFLEECSIETFTNKNGYYLTSLESIIEKKDGNSWYEICAKLVSITTIIRRSDVNGKFKNFFKNIKKELVA
ncbi:hypothetical protein RhiirC2_845588 [Rhizophagus irregularis]|uniref:Uncharacterized protein n=1 Tax=Rhizophagus irregularis TaxID=588596 RepID=A0A2N1NPV1_9GLOM|nr:hypothetical protein RhiirC2_845588 [Rhizophagus irregularis]